MSRKLAASISRTAAVSIVAVSILALASVVTPAGAQETPAKAAMASALAGTLSQQGRVRLIVQLQGDFQPEHELAGPEGIEQSVAVTLQRAMIRQGQDRVLSDLAGSSVQSVQRFKFVPLMGLSVDAPGLDALVRSPNVVSIQEDRPVPPTLYQSVPLIGGDVSTGFGGFSGSGQMVAVLDTGVYSAHPFLPGAVLSEACYSTTDAFYGSTSVCPGGVAESTAAGSGQNCLLSILGCDHGTHVAGIVAGRTTNVGGTLYSGVAKDASILAIQVFSNFDATFCGPLAPCALSWTSDQIKGLERVYALRSTYNIAAVNMSLGGGQYSGFCDSDPTKPIIDLLRAAGIATVIASGNDGYENSVGAPGCISSAVTVGSSTKADGVSSFSNNSPVIVDLLAPGSLIGSSVPFIDYEAWNGTSMATPHVAGAFAVLKSESPAATVNELESALKATGTTISETRLGVFFSKPRVNLDLALAYSPEDYVVSDFSVDARSDILWRHTDGRAKIWQMNGFLKEAAVDVDAPSNAWSIADLGDFDDDGDSDILWRNSSTAAVSIWQMDGFTKGASSPIGTVVSSWVVAGVADFDGDGLADILWRNMTTGMTNIWRMSGLTRLDSATIGSPSLVWEIAGVGDFNGDGKTDIFWRNSSSGANIIWQMDGFTKQAFAFSSVGTAWEVEGVGDFTGDGLADILWRNPGTWSIIVWQMDGATKTAAAFVGTVNPAVWNVARLGDYNGGGQTDILWRSPGSGRTLIWQMNGLVKEDADDIGDVLGWSVR